MEFTLKYVCTDYLSISILLLLMKLTGLDGGLKIKASERQMQIPRTPSTRRLMVNGRDNSFLLSLRQRLQTFIAMFWHCYGLRVTGLGWWVLP